MYIPPAFREDEPAALRRLILEHPFATLVTAGAPGLCASHVPILWAPEGGPHGTLRGHLARANGQWQALETGEEVLAVFHGPHAYVSPAWYEADLAVPTWNYAVVHAYGRPRLVTDEERFREMLEELVRAFETPRTEPWSTANLPEDWLRGLMRGIVGFEIEVNRLEGKFKLGQNRPLADQQRVAARLAAGDNNADRALAALQSERLR